MGPTERTTNDGVEFTVANLAAPRPVADRSSSGGFVPGGFDAQGVVAVPDRLRDGETHLLRGYRPGRRAAASNTRRDGPVEAGSSTVSIYSDDRQPEYPQYYGLHVSDGSDDPAGREPDRDSLVVASGANAAADCAERIAGPDGEVDEVVVPEEGIDGERQREIAEIAGNVTVLEPQARATVALEGGAVEVRPVGRAEETTRGTGGDVGQSVGGL